MRTTIDLPSDLHQLARQLSHETGRSLSDVVASLMRLGLQQGRPVLERSARGVPTISVGRTVTTEDVRALDDDE